MDFFLNPFGTREEILARTMGGYNWDDGTVTIPIEQYENYTGITVEENIYAQQERVNLRNERNAEINKRNIFIAAILIGGYYYAR